jgi:beta-carotene 3-hydroxylase
MNNWFIYISVTLITFFAMEGVAWLAHKYLMHGPLWFLHEDHHIKPPGFFEKNDSFFLIFAIPSWLCIMLGMMYSNYISVSIGAGIALYGLAYAIVHEVFIHQRVKWLRNTDSIYWRAVRRAHKMHHKHLTKHDGENFGMIMVSWKYIKEELEYMKKQRKKESLLDT